MGMGGPEYLQISLSLDSENYTTDTLTEKPRKKAPSNRHKCCKFLSKSTVSIKMQVQYFWIVFFYLHFLWWWVFAYENAYSQRKHSEYWEEPGVFSFGHTSTQSKYILFNFNLKILTL
jgi:hypothetical protein